MMKGKKEKQKRRLENYSGLRNKRVGRGCIEGRKFIRTRKGVVVRVLVRSSSLRNFASGSGGRKRAAATYRGEKGRHKRRRSSVDITKKGMTVVVELVV